MGRKFCMIIMILLLKTNFLQAQKIYSTSSSTNVFVSNFSKCGIDTWSAGGATVSAIGNLTAAGNNPAGMLFEKNMLYTEFGKWSTSDWIEDFKNNGQYIIPSYVSIGIPFRKIMIAVGYLNYYNLRLKNSMEITTINNPEGTGEYLESETNIKLHTYFGAIKYAPNNIIDIGITFGINYLSQSDQIFKLKADGHGWGYSLITGIIIKPFANFTFGYNFKYVSTVKYNLTLKSDPVQLIQIDVDPSLYGNNQNITASLQSDSYPFIGKFPYIFETGLSYHLLENLILYTEIELQKWQLEERENEDIVNYHLGSSFSFAKSATLYFGYFTQDDPRNSYYKIDQKFLTFGISVDIFKLLSISASILDSHVLKQKDQNKNYLQSYYSAGLLIKL